MADVKDPRPGFSEVPRDGPRIVYLSDEECLEDDDRPLSERLSEVSTSVLPFVPLVTDSRFVLPIDPNASFWGLVKAGEYDLVHQSVTAEQFPWDPGEPFVVYPRLSKLPVAMKPAEARNAYLTTKRQVAQPLHILHFMALFKRVERVRDIVAVGAFSPITGGALGIRQKSGKRVLTQFKSDELLDVSMYYLTL